MKYRIIKEAFKSSNDKIHIEDYYIQYKWLLFWHTFITKKGPLKFNTLQDAMKAVDVLETVTSKVTICQLSRYVNE